MSSRRFWTFLVAQILTIATAIIAHYVNDPFGVEMAKMIIAFVQGLAGILITGYTIDDTVSHKAAIMTGVHPYYNCDKK